MRYDFNAFEMAAARFIESERFADALKIYLFMADEDPSLDGGYLGKKIAKCYEALQDLHAASYWYGRAIEENPIVNACCIDKKKTPNIIDRKVGKTRHCRGIIPL
jgi:hypothetical protein